MLGEGAHVSDEPRDVQLEGLLGLVIELVLDRIRGFEVGQVTSYDENRQSCSVQPMVKRAHVGEDETRVVKTASQLHDCPVWHFGSSTGRVTVPVRKGDYGLILYSSVAMDRWKKVGGIVDPGDDRRHDVSDAVFIPGIHSLNAPPTTAPTDAVVTHGATKLGGPEAVDAVVKGTTYRSAEDTLISAMSVFVAAVSAQAAPLGPYPNPTLVTACTVFTTAITAFETGAAGYLSTIVKVK